MLAFLLAAELLCALVGPWFVPSHLYLRLYVGPDAQRNTALTLAGRDPFLLYDPVTGWRSRPDVAVHSWRTDAMGSRSTHSVQPQRDHRRRVLFVGSSTTNGGTGVENNETVSAYVERSDLESVNFGTMLYALDQMYLAYRERLYAFDADVVVVGLPAESADGLDNCYVPFRARQEVNIPLFKPRFYADGEGLALLAVPPRDVYQRLFSDSSVIERYRNIDSAYPAFERFKHFEVLPLSAAVSGLVHRAEPYLRRVLPRSPDATREALRRKLMSAFVEQAEAHGSRLLFMLLPNRGATLTTGWRTRLPDQYGQALANLEREGLPVFDARPVLRASGYPVDTLFHPDGTHFTATGNRVIADGLRPRLEGLLRR